MHNKVTTLTKEERNDYANLWRWANPEKVKAIKKRCRVKNFQKNKDYSDRYRKLHPEIYAKSAARYRRENPEKRRAQDRVKMQRRRKNNPNYRILESLRSRVNSSLRYARICRSVRTVGLLGCSVPNFRIYIESRFEPGMTWDNYGNGAGQWNLDHIIPCALFDLSREDHQRACFHFSNQRPMWAMDNRRKSARIETPSMRLS